MIEVNLSSSGLKEKDLQGGGLLKMVRRAHENLRNLDRSAGTGWVDLPNTSKQEVLNLKKQAKEVNEVADVLLVIGIGGSYLGAKSAISMLKRQPKTEVIFLGTDLNAYKLLKTLEYCKTKSVCVNVISKSGTTTETAITFEMVEAFMKKKYKKNGEYKRRIFVTTDYENGALRKIANAENYVSFVIPRTVGGRFSVLSAVGLFPMAVAGINIERVLQGARDAYNYCYEFTPSNPAYKYASARYLMYAKHKKLIELACSFDDRYYWFKEWHKQLFAESEGKNGRGLFVATANYTTDLHSVGQFVQEGTPIIFETLFDVDTPEEDFKLENLSENCPIANLEGKLLSEVNRCAKVGTINSHSNANTPVITLSVESLTEEAYGELVYVLETACAVSAYLLGVNPFDQPGVEGYKKLMRAELAKR